MSNSNLLLLDALNLTANIQNRKLIFSLKRKIEEQQNEIQQLGEMIQCKIPSSGNET
jgi:predicted oxidoreductase (fatty acid repression mutant protein)